VTGGAEARLAARRRHPSTRAPVPADAVVARVVDRLRAGGVAWPEVAGAVLAARGSAGVDVVDFAARLGVDPGIVARAEAGAVPPASLPAPLRRVVAGSA
jgi:hypothetical protein